MGDMIVVETLLGEVFSQIPDVVVDGKAYKVKYHWGGQDDLNLYMQTEEGNVTPLIWLVQGDRDFYERGEIKRKLKLVIAKNAPSPTDRNPTVWNSEFVDYLNPLLVKVIYGIRSSGIGQVVEGTESIYREANYSYERDEQGKVTNTTDFWNIISYDLDFLFYGNGYECVQTINYNLAN